MTLIRFITALLFTLSFASFAHASNAPASNAITGGTIAAVNVEYVLQKSLAAQHLQKQIETLQSKHNSEIEQQGKNLQTQEKALLKKRETLAQEAFEVQAVEFQKNVEIFQRKDQEFNAKLSDAFNQSLSKIHGIIVEIVAGFAKEKNYVAVLSQSETLYVHSSIDITNKVLDALNKRVDTLELHMKK
jgi:Skp family chaperone for outer membrane proteins